MKPWLHHRKIEDHGATREGKKRVGTKIQLKRFSHDGVGERQFAFGIVGREG
jgi:hypothetical protein